MHSQSSKHYPSGNNKQNYKKKIKQRIEIERNFFVGILRVCDFCFNVQNLLLNKRIYLDVWSEHFVILEFETMASAEVELPSKVSILFELNFQFVYFNATGCESDNRKLRKKKNKWKHLSEWFIGLQWEFRFIVFFVGMTLHLRVLCCILSAFASFTLYSCMCLSADL